MGAMDTTDPIAEVIRATKAHERAKLAADRMERVARDARNAEIRKAAQQVRQADLVRATGLTRETIRRIVGATKTP